MTDQERLQQVLAEAVAAAKASPHWEDGDGIVVILNGRQNTDDEHTVMSTQGFTPVALMDVLLFHADMMAQVIP